MAIASPTLQIAARAAFTEPSLYVAEFLFPRTPIPGAAIKPGEMVYRGKAFRVLKNQNRQSPGTTDLRAVEFQEPQRIFSTLEDYDVDAPVFQVATPIMTTQLTTMDRFGISNWEEDVAAPFLVNTLLNDRERRAAALLVSGNFGKNFTGAGDGYWTDDSVDPIEQIQQAVIDIEQNGGTLESGQMYRMMFSQADFNAFVRNAQVRARFGDAAAPATPADVLNLIKNTVMAGYPAEMQAAFEIRIAKATATTGNVGQPTPGPAYVVTDKTCLVRSQPTIQGNSGDGLRRRSWGKGYSMLELTIDTYEKTDEQAIYYRGQHATAESVYDTSLGALFATMTQ